MKNPYSGTETEKHLRGEAGQGAYDYTLFSIYAMQAEKEGYGQLAALFRQWAQQRKWHAQLWLRELGEGAQAEDENAEAWNEDAYWHVGTTAENLLQVAGNAEFSQLWLKWREGSAMDTARKEGFADLAEKFRKVADAQEAVESQAMDMVRWVLHNADTREALAKIKLCRCRTCGRVAVAKIINGRHICPACHEPKEYDEL